MIIDLLNVYWGIAGCLGCGEGAGYVCSRAFVGYSVPRGSF